MIQASYETGFDIDSLPTTNQSTVDPQQYMYGLEVFHQLHCLVSSSIQKELFNLSKRKLTHNLGHGTTVILPTALLSKTF
jgi:hypothetical protein